MRIVIDNADSDGVRRWHEAENNTTPSTDVHIITSDGRSIPAHSSVLGSASPVLERLLDRPRRSGRSEREIHILGVPYDSVLAFLHFLYSSKTALSSRDGEEAMAEHGVHLLALSHAHRVGWLKDACEAAVAARLTAERVVDAIKLAKLCDAPRLYQKCMRLAVKDFAAVRQSEGWRFLRRHDPALELEILQFMEEVDQRRSKWKRAREAQETYRQLGEAMDCLHHIFTDGCTEVGHRPGGRNPAGNSRTCQVLQRLVRHLGACAKKSAPPEGCLHCKQMVKLLRLHSSVCHHLESCKVPPYKELKTKVRVEEEDDKTWRLLVKKVIIARAMTSLANRKRPQDIPTRIGCRGIR
ncbi:BTB/POZ and TAZ domain-containing protein 1-like [Typha latifolia]|uniref:BTB/POZ and TAZ domain-containing protein 1-like n=1 Tax=Typha latifolia TaxID=4733 RepID=UPI003C2BCBFE